MKKIFRKIIILAAAAASLAATSCHRDDTLRYSNVTMGNVVAGSFISDQGNVFNVVEQNCQGKLDTMKRAIVTCDILRATEGESSTYDVRLTKVNSVLTKDAVKSSEITEDSFKVTDPIHIENIWSSGGYLNMQIIIPIAEGSKQSHMINLVYNDLESKNGSYVFDLRHNGFGEVWTEEAKDFILASGYVSFPIGNVISGDNADLTINWTSHKTVGNAWVLETIDRQLKCQWSRDIFEQAPLDITTKAATDIM